MTDPAQHASLDNATPSEELEARNIPLSLIILNDGNPRRQFEEKALAELTESIRNQGVLQPLIVRPHGNKFQIVAGERRYRASVAAGLKDVPAVIKALDETQTLRVALVENLQRENLNAIEEAETYKRFIDEFGHTQESLAKFLGKDRTTISNTIRLLKLPEQVREWVVEGRLSQGHARAILGLPSPEQQIALAEECIERGMSVRKVEKTVQQEKKRPRRKPQQPSYVEAMERSLSEMLETKVSIKESGKQGQIVIDYASISEFERLYALFQEAASQKHSLEHFLPLDGTRSS